MLDFLHTIKSRVLHRRCKILLIKSGIKKCFIWEVELASIVKKVLDINANASTIDTIISNDTPFGIGSNPKSSKKSPIAIYDFSNTEHNTKLFYIEKLKRKVEYIDKRKVKKNNQDIDTCKVLIPGAGGSGNDGNVIGKPEYAPTNSVCSQSYLSAPFSTEPEALNFLKYLKSKFLRVLVSAIKISQSAPNKVYRFVPMQNFTSVSDINWNCAIEEIDEQLFRKYNLSDEEIKYINDKVKPM